MADSDFGMGYALGADSAGGSRNDGGMWGSDAIWAILLFAMIFGNRGFGGGGLFGGGNDCGSGCATQADVRAAVDQPTLSSKLDQQTYGVADSTYALNNTIVNGFHGVDNAICNLGFQTQSGFNSIASQMAKCCCDIERGIDGVNYNMASHFCNLGNTIHNTTRDIIDNQNCNTRQIMDFLVQSKIDKLQSENEALRLRASQSDQNAVIRAAIDASTAEIIRRTGNECPVPAYVVPNPNCCYGNPLGVGYSYGGTGYNSGCGCGCG